MADRKSFWAWCLESEEPSDADRAALAARLSARYGTEITARPVPSLDDAELRAPRIAVPDSVAAWCSTGIPSAGEMVPTTTPARPTGSSRPQTPQMATMARTRPNSALLKKMDPAPAALVARHSATTARQPTRRPIDTHHRAPAPAAAKTLTPRAPTPRPAPQNSPNKAHNPNTRPQHNPTSKPATRNHTKKHKPEPLTNSRERSGLVILSVDATRSSDSTIRLPTDSDSANQSCMRRRRPLMGRSLRDPTIDGRAGADST